MKASPAEKFDQDAVRAKAPEVGSLDAELTLLRTKAMSEVQPPGPSDLPVAPKLESP
jgi:hypothetical protein